MNKLFANVALTAGALAAPSVGLATDRAQAGVAVMRAQPTENPFAVETIAVTILGGGEEVWSGNLRIGGQYGNASFSMSKNEFATPCPDQAVADANNQMSNFNLSFNLNRQNWPQSPHRFNVNVTWNRPLPPCRGEGSDIVGFNRAVDIPPGRAVSIEGADGLTVRITRPAR